MSGQSFDYSIVADGSKADATNKAVEAGLGRVTAKAAESGRAMTNAFGGPAMRDAQGNINATAYASQQLRQHVEDLTQSWEREDAILERIKGPARDHEADLKALNQLHVEGKVSAKEYEDELDRMNKKKGEGGGEHEGSNPVEKIEGVSALAGGLIGGGIAAEAIELTKSIGELFEASHKLKDEYIGLTNSVQMFATEGRSAEGILSEQVELSEELHSKLQPTIALYQRVAENSDRLALSHENQLRLTRSLGEAVQLNNKPLEDASGIMAKLGQAMETGTVDTRMLNQIIREAPSIVNVWKDSFHESTEQILKDVKNGKIGIEQLIDPLIENGEQLDKLFAKREKTHEQEVDELVTKGKIIAQQTGMSQLMAENISQMSEEGQAYVLGGNAAAQLDKMLAKVNQTIGENTEKTTRAARALGHDFRDAVIAAPAHLLALGTSLDDIGRRMGLVTDAWEKSLGPQEQVIKASMEHASKTGEARQALATLNAEFKNGTIGVMEYKAQHEALLTTIEGGMSTWRKLDHEINDPMRTLTEEMHVVQSMFSVGAIDFDGFYIRMQKIAKGMSALKAEPMIAPFATIAVERMNKDLEVTIESIDRLTGKASGLGNRVGAVSVDHMTQTRTVQVEHVASTDSGISEDALKQADTAVERAHLQALVEGSKATEKFAAEARELDSAEQRQIITVDEHSSMLARLRSRYDDVKTPADEWNRALEIAKEKFTATQYSADQYARAIARINAQYDHSAGQGITNGLVKIRDEMLDVSSVAEKAMTDAFHGIENALVDLATTGKTNWSQMINSMLADLARLALRELEMKLVTSLGGGSLPAHDLGASWTVAGSGGADTSLQAFWASPGETVTVSPAGGSSARQQQPTGRHVTEVHNHFDRRELLSSVRTYEGRTTVMNEMRSNPGALRTILQR